ncbi:ADP-L-glycero-D-manno-heptose-6-epimerase [Helicobacter heilmannii]|uniref:ADP-glyceromanno-heptose 6-epimerase n=1 Tax=Helicobacter heilmannii TaxID=35817 RepID=UPI0006A25775|nr:ADP-glyceromanno-heptose 6-epimerase [Helicobacter heilmannii]CRF50349.1 ADP-L-glycero-D-manno-heptose-6-epimerase [Helicobacter heilmannii]
MYIPNTLENKTIVITGGAGFIGSNLAMYFQTHHPKARVIVIDKFREQTPPTTSLGHFKNLLNFNGEIITADITKDLGVLKKLDFDYLFHQAAISDTTNTNQELVMKTNHQAFIKLLKIAIKKDARVIYASSAGVYGNTPAPNKVGFGQKPENIYGFSKLCMDKSALDFAHESFMPIVGLRYFNVYGPGEFYKHKTASMVLQLGLQALQYKEVKLFEFGEQKRDFVYIEDVIQACVKAMGAMTSGVYNVGYGKSHSYNDIVRLLQEHLGDFKVTYIKNPYDFFQEHTCADIVPTHADLDYAPSYDLKRGVSAYIPTIKELAQC